MGGDALDFNDGCGTIHMPGICIHVCIFANRFDSSQLMSLCGRLDVVHRTIIINTELETLMRPMEQYQSLQRKPNEPRQSQMSVPAKADHLLEDLGLTTDGVVRLRTGLWGRLDVVYHTILVCLRS